MNYNYLRDKTALGVSALVAAQQQPQRDLRRDMARMVNPNQAVAVGQGELTSLFWQIAVPASVGLSAYHGYKRNRGSLEWGVGWGLLGGLFPVITPAIALAQGFAKPR